MNLANKLTMARVIIVPFFVVFMLLTDIPYNYLWALVLFAAASVTDLLDGKIARKRNLITNFGKFLDPLADKILVITALICMVELGWTSAWLVAIIVAREFMVSGVRLVAANSTDNVVIAASIWGKLKTAFTMGAIVLIFAMHILEQFGLIYEPSETQMMMSLVPSGVQFPISAVSFVLMCLAAALTVISGVQYLWQYRHYLDSKN